MFIWYCYCINLLEINAVKVFWCKTWEYEEEIHHYKYTKLYKKKNKLKGEAGIWAPETKFTFCHLSVISTLVNWCYSVGGWWGIKLLLESQLKALIICCKTFFIIIIHLS